MIVVLNALFGFLVGSMLAVILERLYTGASWRGPILPCAECGQPAPAVARLGLPGWLHLRGRRPCGARLPARLVYLPLLAALTFGWAATRVDGFHLVLVLLFAPALLAMTATDFERRLLPNRIMYPTLIAALALSWAWPGRGMEQSLLGGAVGFGAMFLLFLVLPGFGFGDVKLAGLLGLLAGSTYVLPGLALGCVAAGLASAVLLATRRVALRATIAYGPYLALAAFTVML